MSHTEQDRFVSFTIDFQLHFKTFKLHMEGKYEWKWPPRHLRETVDGEVISNFYKGKQAKGVQSPHGLVLPML